MGVYIKGMKMPKTCDDCFLPLQYCPYAMKPNGECPLVPVPPHGRLIDADVLKELYDLGEEFDYCHVNLPVIRQNIDDMPTIIPAEEGE